MQLEMEYDNPASPLVHYRHPCHLREPLQRSASFPRVFLRLAVQAVPICAAQPVRRTVEARRLIGANNCPVEPEIPGPVERCPKIVTIASATKRTSTNRLRSGRSRGELHDRILSGHRVAGRRGPFRAIESGSRITPERAGRPL